MRLTPENQIGIVRGDHHQSHVTPATGLLAPDRPSGWETNERHDPILSETVRVTGDGAVRGLSRIARRVRGSGLPRDTRVGK